MFDKPSLNQLAALFKVFARMDRRFARPLRTWEDFYKTPVMTREQCRLYAASGLKETAFNVTATSGSTASRLLIAHSQGAYTAHLKRLVKLYRSVGARRGELCLNLCAYALNSGGRLMEAAYKAAGCGVIPLGSISSPEKVAEAAGIIAALKPTMINAYTNQLFDLFSVMGRAHTIRTCIVNGEPLWPAYRERIEHLGGVRVHDHYGAMEVSGFAMALKPDDAWMRVVADGLLLEVVAQDKSITPTGVGDLLVTDLNNTCMPFIRYRLGDRVELQRRKGLLWIKVLGRTQDSVLVNGVVVMKQELIQATGDLLRHPSFFFILTKDPIHYCDKMIVNVVGPMPFKPTDLGKRIAQATGMDQCLDVRLYTGAIPRTSNGKISYIIDSRKAA